jgi:hypothetical protein
MAGTVSLEILILSNQITRHTPDNSNLVTYLATPMMRAGQYG